MNSLASEEKTDSQSTVPEDFSEKIIFNLAVLNPASPEALYAISSVYWKRNDIRRGWLYLKRCIQLRPEAVFYCAAAQKLFDVHCVADAKREILKAIALDPGSAGYHALLGEICLRSNTPKAAVDASSRSLWISANNFKALECLRMAFIQMNDMQGAFRFSRDVCLRLFNENVPRKNSSSKATLDIMKIAEKEVEYIPLPILYDKRSIDTYSKVYKSIDREEFILAFPESHCKYATYPVVYGAETITVLSDGNIVDNNDLSVWGYSVDRLFNSILDLSNQYNKGSIDFIDCDIIIPLYQWKWVRNYYHFMVECLPIIILSRKILASGEARLLLDVGPSYVKEALELVGIPETAIVQPDQSCRSYRGAYMIERLNYACYARSSAVRMIRSCLQDALNITAPSGQGRRLYISRCDARQRRVVNEKELMAHLSVLGFEMVECGTLTVQEQVRLFSQAAWVISPHGANMTNIMFMQSGTVLELVSEVFPSEVYWSLASASKLRYAAYVATNVAHDDGYDLLVDCDQLLSFVKHLLKTDAPVDTPAH